VKCLRLFVFEDSNENILAYVKLSGINVYISGLLVNKSTTMMTPFKVVMKVFALAVLLCGLNSRSSAQAFVTLTTPTTVGTATVCPNTTNHVIYQFTLTGSTFGGTNNLTAVTFTQSGTATVPGEITQYRLWRNSVGGTLVATNTSPSFTGLTGQAFVNGTTVNYFITADIANGSGNATIIVNQMSTATNLTFSSDFRKANGTPRVAGGTQQITAVPTAIGGASGLCAGGATTTLTEAAIGGTWTSSTPGVASVGATTGIVTSGTAGTTTITYANTCGSANLPFTVNAVVTSISGNNVICAGTTSPLSDAVAGGTWSSDNNTVATVDVNTGIVSAVSDGGANISYSNGCGIQSYPITVISSNPGTITGPNDVCNGGTTNLTDNVTGGVWSSSIPAVATVDGSGTVFGASIGTTVISYTYTNICGTSTATHSVNVVNAPFPGVIIGPSNICAGSFTILSNTVGGGAWSVNNGNATISGTGVLTAISPGSIIVSYTLTSACGPISATKSMTIFPVLNAGTISGPDNVCATNTIFLTDNVSGGAWSSSNPAIATVTGLGMVTGVSSGTTTISYLVTNGCGSLAATHSVTVNPTPDPGTINGPSAICVGTFALLSNTTAGGVWTSSNTNVATVDNTGLTFGTGLGSANILYTVTNVCGSLSATHPVTVSAAPNAGAISGPASVCVGANIQLSETATGGVWSTSNGNASVSGTGLVTGIAAGTVDISYTSTTPCGTLATSYTITVNPLADAGAITGPSAVCVGSTISLTDAAAGGTWDATPGVLSVDAFGNVTGLTAGSGTVIYSVGNSCNTAFATHVVTVNPVPSVPAISGPSDVCVGAAIHLDNAVTGGLWNTTSTAVTVIGSGSGIDVTGASAGTALISYTVTDGGTGCSTTITGNINVNSLPVTTPILGVTSGCVGIISSLSNATPGGVWSSDNVSVATVDAANGDVTGVATGTAGISYTLTNLAGCSASESVAYTINTIPVSTPISGITTVCEGSTVMLSNETAGGVWSNTTGNASVSTVGAVTGVTAGTDDISYTLTNFCGSASAVVTVTVDPRPVVAPITALFTSVCMGNTVMLDEPSTGGVWSSGNAGVASVDASGVVTGVSVGSATITYSVTNGFGCTTEEMINITVGPSMAPVAVIPGGSATLCHGNPVNLQVVSGAGGLSYQWLTGTTPIPGATNSIYVANLAGTYAAVVDNGTCAQVVGSTVVVLSPNPVINFTAPNTLYTSSYHSYQWYKDGVAIAGAISSLIHTIGDGNYTVVVTDANGCTDTSAVYTIGTVGVANAPAVQSVKIYPNPATAVLHIEAGVKVNAVIMSVDGKVLISQKEATDLDIHNLANGMYMIMVYNEGNALISTAKFVKSE